MARPLRYEAAGAVYHVMARGDGGKTIFDDDKDRFSWLDVEGVSPRFFESSQKSKTGPVDQE